LRILTDHVEAALSLWVELWGMVFRQDPCEAVDRPQRAAQLVSDGVRKGLQLFIGPDKLAIRGFELGV